MSEHDEAQMMQENDIDDHPEPTGAKRDSLGCVLFRARILGVVLIVVGLVIAGGGYFYGTSQATAGLDSPYPWKLVLVEPKRSMVTGPTSPSGETVK